jgi:hypothetical protein
MLVFIGLGDASVLDALALRAPGARVLALEPDPTTAAEAQNSSTLVTWRTSGRLIYLADPDYRGAEVAWRIFPSSDAGPKVLVHPDVRKGDGFERATRLLKKILFGVKANQDARRKFAPRYLLNTLKNIPAIVRGRDVRELTDACRGVPAIIAAAGPSLDRALPELQGLRDRALLIACDTALRPLLTAGISPHLAVGLDPGELNARHFQALPPCPDTWLVAESALDRSATRVFDGRTFWFRVSNHHPWPWLNGLGIDAGQLAAWGSVLTSAFDLACVAGCDPIVFIGADLSYTDGRPYARGTTYEFDWASATSTGRPLEEVWRKQNSHQEVVETSDLHGQPTTASPALIAFRDWIVARAQRSGRRVVNATGNGILCGQGIELGWLPDARKPAEAVSRLVCDSSPRPARMPPRERMADLHRVLAASQDVAVVEQWQAFCGGGFDRAAVAGALGEALDERERGGAAPGLDADAAISGDLLSALHRRLPEHTARLRSALRGEPLPPPLQDAAPADRGEILIAALRGLEAIFTRVLSSPEIMEHSAPVLDAPVHTLHAWAEDTRWKIQLVDAALGSLLEQPLPPIQPAFFTGPVSAPADVHDAAHDRRDRPVARHACALMVLQWLRCAVAVSADRDGTLASACQRVLAISSAVRQESIAAGEASLRIHAASGDSACDLTLPLGLSHHALARAATGYDLEHTEPLELGAIQTDDLSVTIDLHVSAEGSSNSPRRRGARPVLRPEVLSEHLAGAFVGYSNGRGVVCVVPGGNESLVVRDNGAVEQHHRWPRPITLELPFGEGGAVAWSNGITRWPEAGPAYVMYRERPDASPVVEEVPFRPAMGTWFRDRLYWTCLPSGIGAWTGVASWTPGDPTRDLAWSPLFAVEPCADGMVLHPRAILPSGSYERRLIRGGWSWLPGELPAGIDLGPRGAISARVYHGAWTATARPEANLIEIEADGQVWSIVCHWPHRLAWLGTSLFVSTMEREVLVFRDVPRKLGRPDLA